MILDPSANAVELGDLSGTFSTMFDRKSRIVPVSRVKFQKVQREPLYVH
jgi:hypothetical protein